MNNIEIPEFLKNKKESASIIGAAATMAGAFNEAVKAAGIQAPTPEMNKPCTKSTDMTKADVEALSCKIRAMSKEELEVVLDNIPVEMMLPRIESELRKRQAFIDRINGVTDAFSR